MTMAAERVALEKQAQVLTAEYEKVVQRELQATRDELAEEDLRLTRYAVLSLQAPLPPVVRAA
jgi:hypothetical protein